MGGMAENGRFVGCLCVLKDGDVTVVVHGHLVVLFLEWPGKRDEELDWSGVSIYLLSDCGRQEGRIYRMRGLACVSSGPLSLRLSRMQ